MLDISRHAAYPNESGVHALRGHLRDVADIRVLRCVREFDVE